MTSDRPVTFTLSADDHLAANRLHHRRVWRRYGFLKMLAWLTGIYAVLALLVAADWSLSGVVAAMVTATALALAAAIVVMLLSFMLLPRRARRIFVQQKSLHDPIEASWDAEALTLTAANAHSRYLWADFAKWSEGPETLLLYQSDVVFNMLPKRAFSTLQVDDIRSRIAAAGVRRF